MNSNEMLKNEKGTLPIEIAGGLLAHNTMLNIAGQLAPLIIGMITIPFVIRGLGTARFGLLSLAWVVLGYFTIFDLGLGRATTKYVSEALGKGDKDQVPRIVWTAVTAQTLLGVAGGIILAVITPLLAEHVLKVPNELVNEAKTTFYVLAFSVPVVLVSSSYRGVLEALQRFDLVNAVSIPSSCATYLLSLVGLALGFKLPGIVTLILLARIGALGAFVRLSLRAMPKLDSYSGSLTFFPRLFSFGGWITVSSVAGPILVYFDRFLIGSLLSVAALAFYSVPYEIVSRLSFIASSLTITLFPAFSMLEGSKDRRTVETIFASSIKYVLLTLGPIVIAVSLFSKEGLQLWLGPSFARESTVALKILVLGVLINSLAFIPCSLLQAIGRPDLPAKFHLLELPIHISIAWILVSKYGIAGAAIAWTIRVALDALLLFIAALKTLKLGSAIFIKNRLPSAILVLFLLAGGAYGLKVSAASFPLPIQCFLLALPFSLFAWAVWKIAMDALDKEVVTGLIKRIGGLSGRIDTRTRQRKL